MILHDVIGAGGKFRFFPLLICLLSMIILFPFLEQFLAISILVDLLNGVMVFSGVYAISQNRHHFWAASFLALVFFTAVILHRFSGNPSLESVIDLTGALLMGILIFDFCADIVKRDRVTVDVISGAIAVYLLMAGFWAFLYELLYRFSPDSFNISDTLAATGRPFLYFSLVTLTTLGFGDISPVSAVAQSWVTLEAIIGQVYLVVVVAMLVGMHVSQKLIEKSDNAG